MDLRTWLPILIYFLLGTAVAVLLGTLSLVGRQKPSAVKSLPYESGILTTQPAKQRFSIDFYLTAMLFIIFDIELAFLYPLAVVLRDFGAVAVVELIVFAAVLATALVYIWRKGALEWR